ncbi:hypothetical protein Aperf_G00000051711 [Anoplocephala perfoliata]
MTSRTYENAIERLNKMVEEIKASEAPPSNVRMDMQRAYLKASGFDLDAIDRLNIIHVAGSKGKTSTCAYIESILRHEGYKTGLCTSPYLVNVEEHIRINGEPVDRNIFAENFWALVDKFSENKEIYHEYRDPLYLGHILHLALRIFIAERVDVVILEARLGGKYDNTNFIRRPLVTAVSSVEHEHAAILGNTLPEIAWHEAGIFKTNVPAVVARDQEDEVMNVFIETAQAVKCPLYIAPSLEEIHCQSVSLRNWHLLKQKIDEVPVREINICLALAAVSLWHSEKDRISAGFNNSTGSADAKTLAVTPTDCHISGVLSTQVVGRFQELNISKNVNFYLDCAHKIESIRHCAQWFQSVNRAQKSDEPSPYKILLFTVTGNRDPLSMLEILEKLKFDAVYFIGYFCGLIVRLPSELPNLLQCVKRWQERNYSPSCYVLTNDNFAEFIAKIQRWDGATTLHLASGDISARNIQVLATGSLFLIGDVLKLLDQPLKWT